jgi:hypothetical protein
MSAKGASTAFDLQCVVREEMMEFVKEKWPGGGDTVGLVECRIVL